MGNVTIPSNSSITKHGVTSKELEFHSTCAMLVQSEKSIVASDFNITPAVVQYASGRNVIIGAKITNVTNASFTVPPKAVLCELQPVQVYYLNYKKVNKKVQCMPQSQTAANPRHQEEEKKDKNHTPAKQTTNVREAQKPAPSSLSEVIRVPKQTEKRGQRAHEKTLTH